uniref:hypothetical protein n=1 Tax=Cupriavidus yeoncheonensis TaxID=1462994 RepID=UPI003F495F92
MVAYASLTLGNLENHDGRLLESDSVSGFTQVSHLQIQAWKGQLAILRDAARSLISTSPIRADAALVLEYRIPRREKRIDAVILFRDTVVVVEFKVGASTILPEDKVQVLDYTLDLAYYHSESSLTTSEPSGAHAETAHWAFRSLAPHLANASWIPSWDMST